MNKRIVSLLLLSAILLAGCGQETPAPTNDDTTTVGGETETTTAETTVLTDAVPKLDFGGAEFRTIEQDSTQNSFFAEEQTGDVVVDAIYERNREMEERFNVTFVPTQQEAYGTINTLVTNSVMSGTDEYDLVFGQMFESANVATKGIFYNWNEVPYVDLSKPWYTKSIKDATVGDKLFMIESDLCVMYTEQTWLMVYNRTKAEDYPDFPDLYQMVRDGKWTIDQLNTLVSGIYNDINGNTVRDDGDFYGFGAAADACQLAAFFYGCGGKLAEVGEDFTLTHTIASEKSIDILTKLSNLFSKNDGTIKATDKIKVDNRRQGFAEGMLMFAPLQVQDLVCEELRNFNDSYGVLPIPKYDEKQEEYNTMVDGGTNILLVPATASDTQLEMIGALTEAMSAASYYSVTPAYCNIALEAKGTRDEESIEMLRMVLDSRVIDFAYLWNAWSGWVFKLPIYVTGNGAISSAIESYKNQATSHYEKVIEYCTSEE